MKKALITGGSHSELPLIESAKALGFYVVTTGANSEGLGHKAADKYVCGDFSDKEFVTALAEKEQVCAIISGCNDFAYLSAAYACEKLGLSGHDSFKTSQLIHSKDKFREYTRSLGISTPRSVSCKTLDEVKAACGELGFPLVIKPVDLTGGKGVVICRSAEEAAKSAEKAFKV
ncbi:MAG: ATP-grasp domain-containing protein, partial [[Eubacterium] siraeum]|nr:ATP-grasp domain-containing protein [[Eubacterium] siraeum]